MNHLSPCTDGNCHPNCRVGRRERLKFQKDFLRGVDKDAAFLNTVIGVKLDSKGLVFMALKNDLNRLSEYYRLDNKELLKFLRDKQPRIRVDEKDLDVIHNAVRARGPRRTPYQFNTPPTARLLYLKERVESRIISMARAYQYIYSINIDTEEVGRPYEFKARIVERESSGNRKRFTIKVVKPCNINEIVFNSGGFLQAYTKNGSSYIDGANVLPLDIHEDPYPTGWVKTRVIDDISPRRRGMKNAWYTRLNNLDISRFSGGEDYVRSAVSRMCNYREITLQKANPIVISETPF